MKKYTRWLLRLIGPALLLFFLWDSASQGKLDDIVANFGRLEMGPLLLSLGLFPVFVAIKSWRWNIIMRELNLQPPSLWFSMAIYTVGLFLGGMTPGQSGDFIKALYLRKHGQPLAPVMFSILIDRMFDLLIMALFALFGVAVFLDILPRSAQLATIGFAVLLLFLTPGFIARRPREWVMTRTLPLMPDRVRELLERWRNQFSTLSLRPALIVKLLLLSLGSATSTMVRIYLLFLALSLDTIGILEVVSSTALISILQALPISIAGVGLRDSVLIALLDLHGYAKELALSLSALFLLLNIEQIILGFLVTLRYPLDRATFDENAALENT